MPAIQPSSSRSRSQVPAATSFTSIVLGGVHPPPQSNIIEIGRKAKPSYISCQFATSQHPSSLPSPVLIDTLNDVQPATQKSNHHPSPLALHCCQERCENHIPNRSKILQSSLGGTWPYISSSINQAVKLVSQETPSKSPTLEYNREPDPLPISG